MKPIITLVLILLAAGLASAASSIHSQDPENTELRHLLNCSMIKIAERFYILESMDRTPKDQKLRKWIRGKIQSELDVMAAQTLNKKQKAFVQGCRGRLQHYN